MSTKKSARNHKRWPSMLYLLIIIAVITLTGSIVSYNYVVNSYKELEKDKVINIKPGTEIYLEIPKGAHTSDIAGLLKSNGLIRNTFLFTVMSKVNGYDGMYQSGTHIVSKGLRNDELMRILTSQPVIKTVTLPEGLTYKQVVERLIENKVIESKKAFDKAANSSKFDYKFLKSLPARENKLEGYLFPDTYNFGINASPEEVINKMLVNFNDKFKEEYYKQAKKLDLSVDEVVILASIVEREAKLDSERDKIAGVFYNRLKSKNSVLRKLQSCATLEYIFLNRDGAVKQRITDADTKIDNPYNTYLIDGLPPGPICCPGEASLKAALYPDTDGGYYYFVARGDGSHEFSQTYKQHQAAIQQFGRFNWKE